MLRTLSVVILTDYSIVGNANGHKNENIKWSYHFRSAIVSQNNGGAAVSGSYLYGKMIKRGVIAAVAGAGLFLFA